MVAPAECSAAADGHARAFKTVDYYTATIDVNPNAELARKVGGRVLQLTVQRSPKGKTAQAAKSKLKREGLG